MTSGQIQALVFCGPSGSGKSTLIQKLFKNHSDKFGFSISHTTRAPRPKEVDGVHYHFTTKEEMEAAIKNGEFIESAVYSNNIYGTSKKAVENVARNGKVCVLDIDVQGVQQIKKTDMKALYVFVKPPSLETLANRLMRRGTETEETLERRLNAAKEEIKYGDIPNNFDLIVINDSFDKAYETLENYILEQLKRHNQGGELYMRQSAQEVDFLNMKKINRFLQSLRPGMNWKKIPASMPFKGMKKIVCYSGSSIDT